MKGQGRNLFLAFASTLTFVLSFGARATGVAEEQHPLNPPSIHNMLVVGENAVYLSHLPMFQQEGRPPMPHRYQVILEIDFIGDDRDTQGRYAEDRQRHREATIYMLSPTAPFVLPSLVSADPQGNPLRQFNGTIFRGHLERPEGVPILRDAMVHVEQVVYFREFDPEVEKPSQLEYLLFGRGDELFLTHQITKAPDFDQVLAVRVIGHGFTDDELGQGVHLIFPATTNAAASRLKDEQQVAGEIKTGNSQMPEAIQVEVVKELYFEEGELAVPARFQTTSEEERAGFP